LQETVICVSFDQARVLQMGSRLRHECYLIFTSEPRHVIRM